MTPWSSLSASTLMISSSVMKGAAGMSLKRVRWKMTSFGPTASTLFNAVRKNGEFPWIARQPRLQRGIEVCEPGPWRREDGRGQVRCDGVAVAELTRAGAEQRGEFVGGQA